MAFSVATNEHLIRSNLWSAQLKEVLLDELFATKYVDLITDFPDGDTLNIPSIGQAEVHDYVENAPVAYTGMDTGNFTFTIDQYKSSATYITEKMKQDSYVMSRLVASFIPKQHRALAKSMEVKVLDVGPSAQTSASLNLINGAASRWVAQGTNQVLTVQDFSKAKYGLQMANVPMTNLVAIVDPSVGYAIETLTNITTVQNNPMWEGIVATGMSTGTTFLRNIMGFDVYVSQNLKRITAGETINSVSVNTSAVANLFFSATSDVLPFVGCIRQPPKVDSDYNKDLQREEYVTTARYGYKLYRPENLRVVLSATDQV
jgi:HK97 family phage major capsid protein